MRTANSETVVAGKPQFASEFSSGSAVVLCVASGTSFFFLRLRFLTFAMGWGHDESAVCKAAFSSIFGVPIPGNPLPAWALGTAPSLSRPAVVGVGPASHSLDVTTHYMEPLSTKLGLWQLYYKFITC